MFSRFFNFSFSFFVILSTGIPVELEIISAIFSSVIVIMFLVFLFLHLEFSFSNFSLNQISLSLNSAAFSNLCPLIASSLSFSALSILSCKSFKSWGSVYAKVLAFDAASSIKSIALSGKNLSFIYLVESSTAAFIASSVIFTLWCASYLSLKPSNIKIVCSLLGYLILTGLNLLSNAESFSIYFLYSSIVVVPIS